MLRDNLLNLLNKHRQEAVITCEESCICWDLERIIYEFDQDQQGNLTTHAADVGNAHGSYYLVEDNDEMYGTGPHRLQRSQRG